MRILVHRQYKNDFLLTILLNEQEYIYFYVAHKGEIWRKYEGFKRNSMQFYSAIFIAFNLPFFSGTKKKVESYKNDLCYVLFWKYIL